LIYDITVLATAGGTIFFMFAGSDAGLYTAAGLGATAAFTLGYASLRRRAIMLGRGVVRYSRLWAGMTLVSALPLIDGRWQPLVLFALATVAMTLVFALGAWLGSRLPASGKSG
jgi:hypothetical protein